METWFIPVVLDRIEETTAYLAVPNKFFERLAGEHYHDCWRKRSQRSRRRTRMDVSFVVNQKRIPAQAQPDQSAADMADAD